MAEPLERDNAARAFIDRVIARSYDGAIRSSSNVLDQGPAGSKPAPEMVQLHRWYQNLPEQDQKQVRVAIRDAVDATVFGFFVLLDGATGGRPIHGVISDFALYLQTYAYEDARDADTPLTRVKINPANTPDELHDLFRSLLQERARPEN